MSPTLRLAIEWDPRPIDIPDNIEKAIIIKDPLGLVAKLVGKPTPKKEVRETYEPYTLMSSSTSFNAISQKKLIAK